MSNKAPLLEELLKYHKENNMILSMPGNKSGIGFLRDELGREYVKKLGFLDITEVGNLDNLHCPEGVILEAQRLLADTYNVKSAYFVVNGSTAGNLASIFAAFNEGDEILVERNCHKSIYNGLILRKLKVRYIEPKIDEVNGLFLPPDIDKIRKAIIDATNPKGIILTYPNYFGIGYDLKGIIEELKSRDMKIVIDGAHGAHYGTTDKLPRSLTTLADYVVLSAHKTLPSLTQGAYLLVNETNSNVDFYIKAFMTTSPSYLIMASLDYARYYLDVYGKEDYEELIKRAKRWRDKINSLKKVKIISNSDLQEGYGIDDSRYVMVLPKGYCGHKLLDYFKENKIQGEMSFATGVVLLLSPFNCEDDFRVIYNVIYSLDMEVLKNNVYGNYYSIVPEKALEPYEVFDKAFSEVNIEESIGKISREALIPYPPGIPLICGGEKITAEAIDIINNYKKSGRTVIGVNENKIRIID